MFTFWLTEKLFFIFYVSWFHVVPSDYHGNMAQRTDHEMLEEENDKMVDHLSSKVQALKSVLCDYLFISMRLVHWRSNDCIVRSSLITIYISC